MGTAGVEGSRTRIDVSVPDLHEAFVNRQTPGTRLVTTQPAYVLLTWQAAAADADVVMTATADREELARYAPDLLAAGISGVEIEINPPSPVAETTQRGCAGDTGGGGDAEATTLLQEALRTEDPSTRLARCVQALDIRRTPGALLATGSACMEANDLEAAERVLDEAVALAPDWAAAHFERGKLWLRRDGMEHASASFCAAADLMPAFAAAWSNLGATLGELDRPEEALDAFRRALAADPRSAQTHNNIGVVSRELGELADSEAAFRRVLELEPQMAFGYYNLGHTLFLQGRYTAALSAYAEGQKRDPDRNAVQASRLAMCRLATGDATGAITELQRATSALPREYRRQLLADTQTIAWALLTHRPDLPGWQRVHDWLAQEQTK